MGKKLISSILVVTFFIVVAAVVAFTQFSFEDKPPSLGPDAKLQALIKSGEHEFLKWEAEDQQSYNEIKEEFEDSDIEPTPVKKGVNYLYSDTDLTFKEAFLRIDPQAEEGVIAMYSPEENKFLIYPKTTYYDPDATIEVDPEEAVIPAGTGYFLIITQDSEGYGFKTGKARSSLEEVNICTAIEGWNLIASNSEDLNPLISDCLRDVKTVFAQNGDTSFEKVPNDDIEGHSLEDYYLVWFKTKDTGPATCNEPDQALKDFYFNIGKRQFKEAYLSLPPSYQAKIQEEIAPKLKDVLEAYDTAQAAPKLAFDIGELVNVINSDAHYNEIIGLLPLDIREDSEGFEGLDSRENFREDLAGVFAFITAVVEWAQELATDDTIDMSQFFADLGASLLEAELVFEPFVEDFLEDLQLQRYYEFFRILDFMSTVETEIEEEIDENTVIVRVSGDPELAPEGDSAEGLIPMKRVLENDCYYWVVDGLDAPDGAINGYKTGLADRAAMVTANRTADLKTATLDLLDKIADSITTYQTDNKSCEFVGNTIIDIQKYFDIMNDLATATALNSLSTPMNTALAVAEPPDQDLNAGTIKGTWAAGIYTPDVGYTGEDWLLFTGTDDDSFTIKCINVTAE